MKPCAEVCLLLNCDNTVQVLRKNGTYLRKSGLFAGDTNNRVDGYEEYFGQTVYRKAGLDAEYQW